jgi:DNA-binding transcriptional ArsR family regulator
MDEMTPRIERVLDARSLRGLAHPLRIKLLGYLRSEGPATATQLGQIFGESSGTTSWHLRQLADHGFVEEASDLGNRRERWWRASQQSTRLQYSPELQDSAETKAALEVYIDEVVREQFRRAATFTQERDSWPQEWAQASSLSDFDLRLTSEEAFQLGEKLERIIEDYRRAARPGDERVTVQLQIFPRRAPQDTHRNQP